jgi:1-acyl-sn-glycerol-3-phosphate acyltransferase
MLFLRSFIFNVILWAVSIGCALLFLPFTFLPKRILFAPYVWASLTSWVLKIFAGIRYQVEGQENLPKGGFIIASKHQSAWETLSFNHIFPKTAFVLKKELSTFFPLNFHMKHSQMIPLDRKGGKDALRTMVEKAKNIMDQERSLVIFPEGTRTAVGQKAPYKRGIYTLYKYLDKPVVPVALNSGLYWKRRGFIKYPGTIRVKILPPIQPGLPQDVFMKTLEDIIETESQKLLPKES